MRKIVLWLYVDTQNRDFICLNQLQWLCDAHVPVNLPCGAVLLISDVLRCLFTCFGQVTTINLVTVRN